MTINGQTSGCRGVRRAAGFTLAAVVAVVLATACSGSSAPRSTGSRGAAPVGTSGLADCLTASRCLAPSQFQVAYGIQPLLHAGVDGRGQSVVVVEFATAPAPAPKVTDIRQDLADFDTRFKLPALLGGWLVDSPFRFCNHGKHQHSHADRP